MGKLSYYNKRFIFECTNPHNYNEDVYPKQAGFRLNPSTLQWETIQIIKAVKLREFADASAEAKFKKYYLTTYQTPEQIIYPDHLIPKIFQFDSARHICTYSPTYLADEAGLGKTVTASLAMNTIPGKSLIVCPPYLKYNWEIELKTWLMAEHPDDEPKIFIFESGKLPNDNGRTRSRLLHADYIILPDSLLTSGVVQELLQGNVNVNGLFKWGFLDEAHRYNYDSAERTKAALGPITNLCERITFMSGTPMERPIELWPIVNTCAPWVFKYVDLEGYGHVFCNARLVERTEWVNGQRKTITATDRTGDSNLETLKEHLFAKFMISHKKKDVLPELPSKTRNMIFLDQPKKILKMEKKLLANHTMEELLTEDFKIGDVATYRMECGISMIKLASEYLKEKIEHSKKPVVIFANHIEVCSQLTEALKVYNPLTIGGGMKARDKQNIVEAFQTGKNNRPLIGNITAMGTGLTLTRASETVHVEYAWNWKDNEQAEDRVHRIGQNEYTQHTYLVMRNCLHERMLHKILKRKSVTEKVMS